MVLCMLNDLNEVRTRSARQCRSSCVCADAARAFDQLRVHTVPKENINTASTSDDGAVQPPSPRKRKATGSLRADSSVIIHEENKRSSGENIVV